MKNTILLIGFMSLYMSASSQDLSLGLIPNDLTPHPMQELEKPAYLESVIDPSFGTTIRRISDAKEDETIRTMYSTVQAWNADESRMILYKRPGGLHIMLDGMTYEYIKDLPINPSDLEQVFWHFNDPDILFYMDNNTKYLIEYNVATDTKNNIADLRALSGCQDGMTSGNDVQMMSWDSDVFTFRCGNSSSWAYRISTSTIIELPISDIQYTAPSVFPSGDIFLHGTNVIDDEGQLLEINASSGNEHSCLGVDSEGNDYYFSVAFSSNDDDECLGEVIAYDPSTGNCRTIVGTELGYSYPQSGTHISALSHKNTEGGWLAASMVGYAEDGQKLLDQELIIAQITPTGSDVYRIGHHRSDENEFNYWGEPHPVMSPTGTRVVFNSDWSGSDDGYAVDAYVVELPSFTTVVATQNDLDDVSNITVYPNPVTHTINISNLTTGSIVKIYDSLGNLIKTEKPNNDIINMAEIKSGVYFLKVNNPDGKVIAIERIVKL